MYPLQPSYSFLEMAPRSSAGIIPVLRVPRTTHRAAQQLPGTGFWLGTNSVSVRGQMPRDKQANELLLVKGFYEARQAHHRQTSFAGLTSSCKASAQAQKQEEKRGMG